jgi:hypothetical protein
MEFLFVSEDIVNPPYILQHTVILSKPTKIKYGTNPQLIKK